MFRLTVALSILCIAAGAVAPTNDTNTDRVVGGLRANILEHPYQVSILNNGVHFCGGTLLTTDKFVTAAHCFAGLENQILNLAVVLGTASWGSGGVRTKIKSYVSHQLWNERDMNYDVAVGKMDRRVVLSSAIQPAAICGGNPPDGYPLTLSGFGYRRDKAGIVSPDLYTVQLRSITNQKCQRYNHRTPIQSTMICADGVGEGSCQGDSGGPLYDRISNCLAGIVSWGADCAALGYPGVYTSAFAVRPWVDSMMAYLDRI